MLLDLTGKHFGRLIVIERAENAGRHPKWKCVCECGREAVIYGSNLRQGYTKSCGCLHSEKTVEAHTTHGKARSPEYITWRNMIDRCSNRNRREFKDYGGRGIAVCERWTVFENFFEDMGSKPEGLSLDRIDVNSGYSKENCRWATAKEQARNTTKNRIIEFNGLSRPLAEHCELLGLNYRTVHQRLKRGWGISKALSN